MLCGAGNSAAVKRCKASVASANDPAAILLHSALFHFRSALKTTIGGSVCSFTKRRGCSIRKTVADADTFRGYQQSGLGKVGADELAAFATVAQENPSRRANMEKFGHIRTRAARPKLSFGLCRHSVKQSGRLRRGDVESGHMWAELHAPATYSSRRGLRQTCT